MLPCFHVRMVVQWNTSECIKLFSDKNEIRFLPVPSSLLECHQGLYDPVGNVMLRRHHRRHHVLLTLLLLRKVQPLLCCRNHVFYLQWVSIICL